MAIRTTKTIVIVIIMCMRLSAFGDGLYIDRLEAIYLDFRVITVYTLDPETSTYFM